MFTCLLLCDPAHRRREDGRTVKGAAMFVLPLNPFSHFPIGLEILSHEVCRGGGRGGLAERGMPGSSDSTRHILDFFAQDKMIKSLIPLKGYLCHG